MMMKEQFVIDNYYSTVYDSPSYLIAQVKSINSDRSEIEVIVNCGDTYRTELIKSSSKDYEEFILTIDDEQMLFVSNDYLIVDKKLLNSLTVIKPKLLVKMLLSKDVTEAYKKKLVQHLVISEEQLRQQFAQMMEYYRQKYHHKYEKLSRKYEEIEQQMIAANKIKDALFDWDFKRAESTFYNQKSTKLINKCNRLWHMLKKLGYSYSIKNDEFIID